MHPTNFGTSVKSMVLLVLLLGTAQESPADTGTGSVSLTTIGSPVTENFDTLSNTGGSTTNTALPTGWYITEQGGGARDNEQYAVDTGASTTGDIYSYGAAANIERALGALRSGTLIPFYGGKFTNNTGTTITSLAVSYTGEEWRLGAAGRTDRIDFQISLDATDLTTGTYTDVDALDFTTPDTAGTAGARDGNSAADRTAISATIPSLNIPNGATFFIRWTDLDPAGADDGLAVDDFSVTPNSTGGPTPTPSPTPSASPTPTPSATPAPIRIHDIQGAAHLSPLSGLTVANVPGIVTAKVSNGFYLQDPSPDANDATSEGIFVFTSSAPTVNIGDAILVGGAVVEFRSGGSGSTNLTGTEISSPTISVQSTGNALPAAIVVGTGGRIPPSTVIEDDAAGSVETSGVFDPATDGIDFYESLEAMRVQINGAVVVGPRGSVGEIPVLSDDGANASVRTTRGGIVVRSNDFNPERIILDDLILATPVVHVGDHFSGPVVGVMDYSFGNFKLLITQALTAVPGGLTRETTAIPTATQLAIATFNVENLDPGDPPAQFAALASLIVNNLRSPDLIAVEEIQDNNGPTNDAVVDATTTYNTLISAIQTAGGPTYLFRQINPVDDQDGGEPGGNIRVGFLFRVDRGLTFTDRAGGCSTCATTVANGPSGVELSFSPGRIDPTNTAFNNSRKPLAGEFTFNGQKLFVIGNHFNSKGGDDPLFGRFQPPVLSSETQRTQQAQIVNNFVDSILALNASAKIVVLGDLNDFHFSTPINTLKGGVLHALIETLPESERYTYEFEGNAQALDHILVSDNLFSGLFDYDVVHVNAEFADQISDHDPQVVRLTLAGSVTPTPTPTVSPTATPATPTPSPTATVSPTPTATVPPTPSPTATPSASASPSTTPCIVNPTFANAAPITINDAGTASPYPSNIAVSGIIGPVIKLTVTVTGFNHTFPSDVDMLLVGPGGQKFILVSDVIGGTDAVGINWTFDDAAPAFIGSTGTPASGTFKPTNYTTCQDPFAAPAPTGPYLTPGGIGTPCGTDTLAAFNFVNPNGTWSLYVVDDLGADVGNITGGWSLNFTIVPPPCPSPTPGTPPPSPTVTPGTPTPSPSATASPSATVTPGTPSPTPTCVPTITESSTQTITPLNSVSCNNGMGHTDNSYWRAFNMSSFVGSTTYNVTSVSFGIEQATGAGGTQPITVRLHTSNQPFPTGYPASLTQIATASINVPDSASNAIFTVPIAATVPANAILVMEVFTPDGTITGNLLFLGSNPDPESAPSYLSAAACGITTPTTTAAIGFPNMHLVFDVNGGDCPDPPSPTPTATVSPTITPSPTATPSVSPTATVPPSPTATPSATIVPTPSPSATIAATPTPSPSATPPTHCINLSTRMRIETGDRVGIGGFIITGNADKEVLLRGIGPSLTGFGVPNALADPVLELHGPGAFVTVINNDWRDTQEVEIQATGIPPINDLEAAILVTLSPGTYTAIVRGNGATAADRSGVALVEVYDLSQTSGSKLANLSTRAFVSTGSDIVIAGFLLSDGNGTDRIVVRGIGPSLAPTPFPVSAVLADPILELRDSNGTLLVGNNDWQDNPAQAAELIADGLAPSNALESGIAATLPPGAYTALLAGLNNGTGLGVVEVYDLGP